jgi:Flp pilus assembly protein TadD
MQVDCLAGPACQDAAGHNARAVAQAQRGLYRRALAEFGLALALAPGDARAHNNRGYTLAALREHRRALAHFDRAVELDPLFAAAKCNRRAMARCLQLEQSARVSIPFMTSSTGDGFGQGWQRG